LKHFVSLDFEAEILITCMSWIALPIQKLRRL